MLRELEARCLFTLPLAETGAYRYHEVFRLHLLGVLVDTVGEDRIARAGTSGPASCWRRLGPCRRRSTPCAGPRPGRPWPTSWAATDRRSRTAPRHGWRPCRRRCSATTRGSILARARTLRAQGHFRAAADAFADAEAAFGDADGAATAGRERAPLLPWLDPDPPRAVHEASPADLAGGPSSALRAATIRDPGRRSKRLAGRADPPSDSWPDSRPCWRAIRRVPRASWRRLPRRPTCRVWWPSRRGSGTGVARALRGDLGGASDIEAGIVAAEALGVEWLERIGRACLTLVGADDRDARLVADAAAASADAWGAALTGSLAGLVDARMPMPAPELLAAAATGFRRLGAPVLEAWARALLALSLGRIDHPETEQAALAADALARTTGVLPARGLAQLALAWVRGDPHGELATAGPLDARGCRPGGARLGGRGLTMSAADSAPAGRTRWRRTLRLACRGLVEARCLGSLELIIDGQPVDLATARPRVRSLLRLLLSEPGAPFHHEVIAEAFWPDAEPEVGARNLHAAVAALRRLVEPGVARGSFQLVVRDGAAYRFVVAPRSRVDVLQFDAAVETARPARAAGDASRAESAWREALALYRGDLLADEGPASWLEEPRERRRQQAVEAAEAVARCVLRAGRAGRRGPRVHPGPAHRPISRPAVAAAHRASGSAPVTRVRRAALARATTRCSSSWASPPTPESRRAAQRMALNSSSRMATGSSSGPGACR